MNLTALDIFVDVMRKGSLSAVARDRDTTPSSISRTIASLESELGARLFQRTTRRVEPTEAATLLLARVEPHLDGLRRAQEAVADSTGVARGRLRVTASTSFGVTCIGPLLSEFAQLHPALAIELHLTDAVVDLIGERFDLAIRHGPLPDSNLIAQPLIATRYFACASEGLLQRLGRPAAPEELARFPCLAFPLPGFATTWRFRDARDQVTDVAIAGNITVNSGIVLRQCALDGAGVVLLSDWLIGDDLKAGRLIDLFPHYVASPSNFQTAISAVYPSRKQVPRKVKLLVDYLRRRLQTRATVIAPSRAQVR